MELLCYKLYPNVPKIVPASLNRDWMDASPARFAYRCLPLMIANSYGWDILSPCTFEAEWSGQPELEAIQLRFLDEPHRFKRWVASHFGSGILTFSLGYLFRTPPGWNLFCTGSLNRPKHGIAPLTGVVETDWSPFTFTMNWKMTAPGIVTFEKDEPICTIFPVQQNVLEQVRPEIRLIDTDPKLQAECETWSKSRADFQTKLNNNDPETVRQAWQKHYFRGENMSREVSVPSHKTRMRLQPPVEQEKDDDKSSL
jgi:hypothetical protein